MIEIWLAVAQIAGRPMEGAAYEFVQEIAATNDTDILGSPTDDGAVGAYANALLWVRTGEPDYRNQTISLIEAAPDSACGHSSSPIRVHALKILTLIIAANLIDYHEPWFAAWLQEMLHEACGSSRTLLEVAEQRPNNWGTNALATVMAIALYTGDSELYDHAINILRGWLGDRSYYSSFDYGDLCWQYNPDEPVGINPLGAVIAGVDVDGVLPDDQRRTGDCPPDPVVCDNYIMSGIAGIRVALEMARANGYPDALSWSDSALMRADLSIETDGCGFVNAPSENDRWQGYFANFAHENLVVEVAEEVTPGKSMFGCSWTHPTCRHDYDSDGVIGASDFYILLGNWRGIENFLELLGSWGNC